MSLNAKKLCLECHKDVVMYGKYCCNPNELVCILCDDKTCKKCKKKRCLRLDNSNSIKQPYPSSYSSYSLSKECCLCNKNSRVLDQDLFYDQKCKKYYCHGCIWIFFSDIQEIRAKMKEKHNEQIQINIELACRCQFKKKEIIQYLAKYCIHCSKKLFHSKIKLKNQLYVNQDCYSRLKRYSKSNRLDASQQYIYKRLEELISECQSCGEIIDGIRCKVGSTIDGMQICTVCIIRNELQEDALQKKKSYMKYQPYKVFNKDNRSSEKGWCCNCFNWIIISEGTKIDDEYMCSICLPIPKQQEKKQKQPEEFVPYEPQYGQYEVYNEDLHVSYQADKQEPKIHDKNDHQKQKNNSFSESKEANLSKSRFLVAIDQLASKINDHSINDRDNIPQNIPIKLDRPLIIQQKPIQLFKIHQKEDNNKINKEQKGRHGHQDVYLSKNQEHILEFNQNLGKDFVNLQFFPPNDKRKEKEQQNEKDIAKKAEGIHENEYELENLSMERLQSCEDQFKNPKVVNLTLVIHKNVQKSCWKCNIQIAENLLFKVSLLIDKNNKESYRLMQAHQMSKKQSQHIELCCLMCYSQLKNKAIKEKQRFQDLNSRAFKSVHKVEKKKVENLTNTAKSRFGFGMQESYLGDSNKIINSRMSVLGKTQQREQLCFKCWKRAKKSQYNQAKNMCKQCEIKEKQKTSAIQVDLFCRKCSKKTKSSQFNKTKQLCNSCELKQPEKERLNSKKDAKKCTWCSSVVQIEGNRCIKCRYQFNSYSKPLHRY